MNAPSLIKEGAFAIILSDKDEGHAARGSSSPGSSEVPFTLGKIEAIKGKKTQQMKKTKTTTKKQRISSSQDEEEEEEELAVVVTLFDRDSVRENRQGRLRFRLKMPSDAGIDANGGDSSSGNRLLECPPSHVSCLVPCLQEGGKSQFFSTAVTLAEVLEAWESLHAKTESEMMK